MDVGTWLRGLRLSHYERAFRDNEIEADILPDLTESDLEKLGLPLGPRKRLLRAIANLADPPRGLNAPASTGADAAERRHLTVMFCDLADSTAMSARLDPEDMHQVIRAYQDACSGVVARYEGFVAKFMGDGILVYFGFPQAHEDDAERAVRAGLEIVHTVSGLATTPGERLEARIGIATGLVVVGDLIGHGAAQEQAVVGDTPNLAARLQALAKPGGIVIAAATRRLLDDRFALRDLGCHTIKGFAEPVEAWAAESVTAKIRFQAAHAAHLMSFVGREAESAELRRCQRLAWGGDGQTVLISGEAGIGKSRFCAWLAQEIADPPHVRMHYQCSAYHRDSALYPLVQQLERTAGITPQQAPEIKLDRLETMLGLAASRTKEIAPLVASLLSIPAETRYPPLGLSPAQQRRQTFAALLDQIEGLARQKPVLMLYEDAHWADATSLELLDHVIERIRRLPVLLLITHRPEFDPPWKGRPSVTGLTLTRLDLGEAELLVERLTGGCILPEEVTAQIIAKTDGVPLFIEEQTKNVLESGLLVADGERYRLDGPLPPLAIPLTLQDSLMARLDRLAGAKEVAQIGAAIGREFSYGLLNAVVGRDEASLRDALTQLQDAELVFRTGEPPEACYRFKHALVQETAYESLLKSRRQILHRHIASILCERFAAIAEAEPETLAHHFTQAGLTSQAIDHWGKAGDLALRRSAFPEAIAHLRKAIEMMETSPQETAAPAARRVQLQVALGNAFNHSRGYHSPESKVAFGRARELIADVGDPGERFATYYGIWSGASVRNAADEMREIADAMLAEVVERPASSEACIAHRIAGVSSWFMDGDFFTACDHLERAAGLHEPARDRELAFSFGQDIGVSAKAHLAIALWLAGEHARARAVADEALAEAHQSGHPPTIVYAAFYRAWYEAIRLDAPSTQRHMDAALALAQEHGLSFWSFYGAVFQCWATFVQDQSRSNLEAMRRALAASEEQGLRSGAVHLRILLASAELSAGEIGDALATVELAISMAEQSGQHGFLAEAQRVRGTILAKRNPDDRSPAEQALLAAINLARTQEARSFELRAALDLSAIYRGSGRHDEARALLADIADFPAVSEARLTPSDVSP
ncbi:MAG: AAA family ATPase [Bradyrhizobium sp.]|uniref:adenylate/guanylate cyclase domain-containing protein n=1 Tax=Bradyrhizobium sp. TaxID=376 RepID=UPI001D9E05F9|nr:adenylate/guanylate cyclase domain-containing protein [Bradyrhizobium sp.]MBV9565476.1 AAA family ATPase [Bradyrhizobium sp.]